MKVLVVGGSGLIGGEIALQLNQKGHEVTIMARKPPTAAALKALNFLPGDYLHAEIDKTQLAAFDWLVFSAAADIRNLPLDGSATDKEFYTQVNDIAVPRFIQAAKNAGIQKVVYIGTFYPQVAPQQIGSCPYVTSRHNTCESILALADDNFDVCAINAPFVLGYIEGLPIPHITALIDYAKGNIEGLKAFAPVGGTNHITSQSMAEATLNCFEHGESGHAYLVGDENYSWQEYLTLWFNAVGNPQDLPTLEDEHPMIPYVIQFAGPGATISYEPDTKTMADLAYSRHQIKDLIKKIADQCS